MAASVGIPTQLLLQDSVLAYFCRASVMWQLSIALYCKAGGVPWKLADSEPETAYVGLSYAMRSQESDKPKFVTCHDVEERQHERGHREYRVTTTLTSITSQVLIGQGVDSCSTLENKYRL